jgi:hypothetical protein
MQPSCVLPRAAPRAQAIKLVRGVTIDMSSGDNFTFTVFSFISWFKVKQAPHHGSTFL